ncbi:phage baseplate protein [Aestuariibius insulae]|uniref:phage baseplate protein n=1 Tax=Aestuariibius insulae TaxID=2058287 RepID=UPI00345E4182
MKRRIVLVIDVLENIPPGTMAGILSGLAVTILVGVWSELRRWLDRHPWASGAAAGAVVALLLSGANPTEDESAMLPDGIIVASLKRCEDLANDWTDYTAAAGRVIVGVGSTTIRAVTRSFAPTETDGYWEHVLLEDELPAHRHGYRDFYWLQDKGTAEQNQVPTLGFLPSGVGASGTDRGLNVGWYRDVETSLSKGGKAHNNMQPYIVLYFCEKKPT